MSEPRPAPEGYATETAPLQGPADPDIAVMDAGENRQADWAANARLSIGGGEPHHLALSLDGWLGEDPNHTQNGLYGYAGVGLSFEMM